jgi:sortase A
MAPTPGVAAGRVVVVLLVVAVAGGVKACGDGGGSPSTGPEPTASPAGATPDPAPKVTRSPVRSAPAAPPVAAPGRVPARRDPGRRDPARLSIPSIGVRSLPVVAYTGQADDAPGTRIQDRALAASPRGRRGGVGPGQVGNFIVTAHRTTAGGPFRRLPSVRHGAHILIASGDLVYDYAVTGTLTISFRSARSRASQSAPVPGHPGRPATQAMITLSTCATPEDHARGNFWADALGNPEHRIDKVGVLVAVRQA